MSYRLFLYLLLFIPIGGWGQSVAPWQAIKIHYNTSNNGIPDIIYVMYKDKKDYIWMGTKQGLLRYDGNNFKLYTTNDGLPDNEVFNIIEDNRERFWLVTYNPNISYIKNNIIYNNENAAFVRQINIRNKNKSYLHPTMLNTDSSILFYHLTGDEIIEVKEDTSYFIPSPFYVFNFTEHFFGYVKYPDATYGMITSEGILNFDRFGKFIKYTRMAIDQFSLTQYASRSIYLTNGQLLDAKLDTIAFSGDTRQFLNTNYFIPSFVNGALKIATPSGLYASNGQSSYHSLKPTVTLAGALNDTWVGTFGYGVYRQLENIFSRTQKFIPNTPAYMLPDHLLTKPRIVTMGKYDYLLAKYKVKLLIRNRYEVAFNDSTNKIISVTCDHKQEQLLVCGFKYAYRVQHNQAYKIKTSRDFKRMIAIGNGYFAMAAKELCYLDADFNLTTSWSRPNITNLLNVNDSLLLIMNRNYLELVQLKDRQLVPKAVFKSNFITDPALSASLQGNELQVQTEHTAYKFLLNGAPSYPIRLDVDQLTINKKVYTAKNIALPYGKHYLVHFNLSHVDHMYGDCQYEYSFYTDQNQEPEWITSAQEQITLLLDNPGNYTLKVRARSSNQTLSNTITYHFSIPMPFWRHSFFLISITIIASGAVFYIFYSIQKKKKERQLKHKELELRFFQSELRSLNALMNPHFTFNALNSIQFLINDQQNESAQKYLSTFAGLLRRNLYNLENEFISLENELELIKSYLKLEQMRMKHNFSYAIHIEQDIELSGILIPPLLIQPLVENAVIHGVSGYLNKEGFIKIIVASRGSYCCIAVMDNGAETPELNPQKSFGLKNIMERIQQINSRYGKKYTLSITERYLADAITWTKLDIILEG